MDAGVSSENVLCYLRRKQYVITMKQYNYSVPLKLQNLNESDKDE